MQEIVKKLIDEQKTISTMESCTGGAVANSITNVTNSGDVFKFGAITYSNNYKIKMGVDEKLIEKYTVYSMEVAKDMAKVIANFTNTNYGIGITGKLNRQDKNNPYGDDNTVFISIYDKDKNEYFDSTLKVSGITRSESKNEIIEKVKTMLKEII